MDTTPQAPETTEVAPSLAPPIEGPTFPPGTKLREYETIYALKPDLSDELVEKFKERMRGLVTREGGKVIKFTIWGKKKVHYELAKNTRAVFTHMLYVGPAKVVAEIERNLRNDENMVRYQTIKIADESDANKPIEQDVKLAGDIEAPERPPREERERREDFGDAGESPDVGESSDDVESA